MIQQIIDAIVMALFNEFGNNYTYYTDFVAQNMDTPSFMVLPISELDMREIGIRHSITVPIEIKYFPSDKSYSERILLSERLRTAIESLAIGGYIYHPTDVECQYIDDVLVVTLNVNYSVFEDNGSGTVEDGTMTTNTINLEIE